MDMYMLNKTRFSVKKIDTLNNTVLVYWFVNLGISFHEDSSDNHVLHNRFKVLKKVEIDIFNSNNKNVSFFRTKHFMF